MLTLAQTAYLDSAFDRPCELPHAGSSLENPYVYDASAREIVAMAEDGLVEIVCDEREQVGDASMIRHLAFRRLR